MHQVATLFVPSRPSGDPSGCQHDHGPPQSLLNHSYRIDSDEASFLCSRPVEAFTAALAIVAREMCVASRRISLDNSELELARRLCQQRSAPARPR